MSEPERAALSASQKWREWHRLWLDGALSTDSLLAYALVNAKDCPAAWMWAMTVMELRMRKPSSLVVIANV